MLEKLLSLLLHAKAGAISGVLLLGATGALVSVSAQSGVTTITITEASPTPTATATTPASESPKPSSSTTLSSPKSADTTACSDEAKVLALQVQRVDTAFAGFHTDLAKLRGQRDRATIEKADETLKLVRRSAVTAIHATATCKKDDDEDKDEDKDEDDATTATTGTTSVNTDRENDEDKNDEDKNDDHGKDNTLITFTGDATSIATQAIAAMQTAFDTAPNAAAVTPKPSHSPEQKRTDNKTKDGKSSEHHD